MQKPPCGVVLVKVLFSRLSIEGENIAEIVIVAAVAAEQAKNMANPKGLINRLISLNLNLKSHYNKSCLQTELLMIIFSLRD